MISKDLNVCLYPMKIQWDNISENISTLKNSLSSVHPNTDLFILPETFATGFPSGKSKEEILNLINDNQQFLLSELRNLAHKYNLAIACTLIYAEKDRLYNRALFIEPNGDITHANKKHLFTMAGENEIFTPGDRRLKIRYRGWNIAMAICYDIRFPIWCRNVNNEYDILIVSANWPEVRISAWNKLLPARAIENEAYVCAVNCKGTDTKNFSYDGSSAIIDFKGNPIGTEIHISDSDSMIYATLSRSALDKFREKFPAYADADPFNLL